MNLDDLAQILEKEQIPIKINEPLEKYTTFRIGGSAKILALPENTDQLLKLQKAILKASDIPRFLLGGGSNILIADGLFEGVMIHPNFPEEISVMENSQESVTVEVPASARAPWVGRRLSEKGFSGLEFLTTIPGQFGGAVIQNAGCYGWELKDVLHSVTTVENGKVRNFPVDECKFSYRNSLFKTAKDIWIASAVLMLNADEHEKIQHRLEDYKSRRLASQPRNRRSAGSIFKNPNPEKSNGKKAWQLIDDAGLRGITRNGASISAEHCNFIVNDKTATAADVYFLIKLIEKDVLQKTGVQLEKEVVLVGKFD
jgi:UDP-N-acetylmuramate dehydrogenase